MDRTLTPAQLEHDLAVRDLTDPAAGPHAIQSLVDIATDALARRWHCQPRLCRGPRVVTVADNYDRLRIDPGTVTRDARYTRYVATDRMLRSHASAMVPPALRALAAEHAQRGHPGPPDDVLLVCPGVTYRRDAIDRLHTGMPHQLDLWRITRRPMRQADLDEMVDTLAAALLPGLPYRAEPRDHPYTLDGRQIDARTGDEWVEVWECGVAHPEVLSDAGLDGWSGLALGMGLDRLLMLRKRVPDIRLLRSTDPRVASQMLDLSPYRTVSDLPAARRDLSVATAADDTAEDLGDRVREALGDEAALIEEVAVLSETPGAALPPAAIERLGLAPGQKNVLVRLVLRPLDRTLTSAEANRLRDRVHAAIHQGAVPVRAEAGP